MGGLETALGRNGRRSHTILSEVHPRGVIKPLGVYDPERDSKPRVDERGQRETIALTPIPEERMVDAVRHVRRYGGETLDVYLWNPIPGTQ